MNDALKRRASDTLADSVFLQSDDTVVPISTYVSTSNAGSQNKAN